MPPSAPRSIVPKINNTTLTLEWNEPLDSGGRADLSYTVRCSVCRSSKGPCLPCGDSVSYRPAQHGLVGRRVEVWGLLPHTTYSFTIIALNGVSQLSGTDPASESVNITTSHDGTRRLRGQQVCARLFVSFIVLSFLVPALLSVIRKSNSTESSLTLHWTVPVQPHNSILQYQLRYCEKVNAHFTFHFMPI